MQDAIPTVAVALGIRNPEELFVENDVLTPAILAALKTAIARHDDDEGRGQGWQRKVLLTAARQLLRKPQDLPAALRLVDVARPDLRDKPSFTHIRLIALGQLKRFSEMLAECDRLTAGSPPDAKSAYVRDAVVKEFRKDLLRAPSLAVHRALWGAFPDNLVDKLEAITSDPAQTIPDFTPALRYLHERTRLQNCSFDEYVARHRKGYIAAEYLEFINRLSTRVPQAAGMIGRDIMLPMANAPKHPTDRSLLTLATHIGVYNTLTHRHFPDSDLPQSIVGNSLRRDDDGGFHVSPAAPGGHIKFMKLTKMLKKEARSVLVKPDGGRGDLVELNILGTTMTFGRGAAMLAFYGTAVTQFVWTTWEWPRLRVAFRTGPSPLPGETLQDYEPRLWAFFGSCVEDILTGPPENFGVFARKLSRLLTSEKNR